MLCATLANLHRDPKKRRRPYTPDEFMPKWAPKDPQTPEEQAAKLRSLTAALGGQVC